MHSLKTLSSRNFLILRNTDDTKQMRGFFSKFKQIFNKPSDSSDNKSVPLDILTIKAYICDANKIVKPFYWIDVAGQSAASRIRDSTNFYANRWASNRNLNHFQFKGRYCPFLNTRTMLKPNYYLGTSIRTFVHCECSKSGESFKDIDTHLYEKKGEKAKSESKGSATNRNASYSKVWFINQKKRKADLFPHYVWDSKIPEYTTETKQDSYKFSCNQEWVVNLKQFILNPDEILNSKGLPLRPISLVEEAEVGEALRSKLVNRKVEKLDFGDLSKIMKKSEYAAGDTELINDEYNIPTEIPLNGELIAWTNIIDASTPPTEVEEVISDRLETISSDENNEYEQNDVDKETSGEIDNNLPLINKPMPNESNDNNSAKSGNGLQPIKKFHTFAPVELRPPGLISKRLQKLRYNDRRNYSASVPKDTANRNNLTKSPNPKIKIDNNPECSQEEVDPLKVTCAEAEGCKIKTDKDSGIRLKTIQPDAHLKKLQKDKKLDEFFDKKKVSDLVCKPLTRKVSKEDIELNKKSNDNGKEFLTVSDEEMANIYEMKNYDYLKIRDYKSTSSLVRSPGKLKNTNI